ncbi:MAG: hypothetical protein IPL61_13285 [Myxococcales bacterium]|nr:hypothetical protein [Myxococcales bacterium]
MTTDSERPELLLVASDTKLGEIRRRWFGTRNSLGVDRVDLPTARRAFRFDIGHPVDGQVYLRHPCRLDYYLVPAHANERMAQEKLAAFTQIAAALGARRVELVSAVMTKGTQEGKLSIPVLAKTLGLGLSADVVREGEVTRHVHAEFNEPTKPPSFPAELRAWLEGDPILNGLVAIRMNERPIHCKVVLSISDVFEGGGKVDLELGKMGLGIGVSAGSVGRSTWSFNIEFWPADESSLTTSLTRQLPALLPQVDGRSEPSNDDLEFRPQRRGGVFLAVLGTLVVGVACVVVTLVVTRSGRAPATSPAEASAGVPAASASADPLPSPEASAAQAGGRPGTPIASPGRRAAPIYDAASRNGPRDAGADAAKVNDSTLTPDQVLRKILSAYMGGLKRCHKDLLHTDPTAGGKVRLAFTVSELGRAVRPKSTGFSAQLDACIEQQIGGWRFDVPMDTNGRPSEASFEIALQLVPE